MSDVGMVVLMPRRFAIPRRPFRAHLDGQEGTSCCLKARVNGHSVLSGKYMTGRHRHSRCFSSPGSKVWVCEGKCFLATVNHSVGPFTCREASLVLLQFSGQRPFVQCSANSSLCLQVCHLLIHQRHTRAPIQRPDCFRILRSSNDRQLTSLYIATKS